MLFNSIDFALFLPVVFTIYWLLKKNIKFQNLFLILSSYFFYAYWDWRFLILIILSTLLDYLIGIQIAKENSLKKRKIYLFSSLFFNLSLLIIFKYFNFFLENFKFAFHFFGKEIDDFSLKIVLPVGISFYTFQTLSYTIDIYRKKIEPTKDLFAFCAYISFFPQLVAGPIERASKLLPQFYYKRNFNYNMATMGLKFILWGFFKKIVIADNCAIYVNDIFFNYETSSGSTLFLGTILFAFQIYGDFSGYSDIAVGVAKLFGISLSQNFAYPYFSRDVAEFWRKWHISLTTWFRDYLYIPLGGSKGSSIKKIRNIFIIFITSGFWHGANWTFIFWGILNALFFIPYLLTKKNRNHIDIIAAEKKLPSLKEIFSILFTFFLINISWIFFRSENLNQTVIILKKIFSKNFLNIPQIFTDKNFLQLVILIFIFNLVEWKSRKENFPLENISKLQPVKRWFIYIVLSWLILTLGNFKKTEFIYFAF